MTTTNFDAHFGVTSANGWQDKPYIQTKCSLAKYTREDFERTPRLKGSYRLGELQIQSHVSEAASLDLRVLKKQYDAQVAKLDRQISTEEDANKKSSLQAQRLNMKPPKLPFQVLDELVRRAFSEYNSNLLVKFLTLNPNAPLSAYQAPKLHAYVVSKLENNYDDRTFTVDALAKLLQGWRQTMEITPEKRFYLAEEVRKQREAQRREQQLKNDEAYRKNIQENTPAPAPAAAPVISAVSGVAAPNAAPVPEQVVAVPEQVVAVSYKKKRKKPKSTKGTNAVRNVVFKKRRNAPSSPKATPADTNPLMTI